MSRMSPPIPSFGRQSSGFYLPDHISSYTILLVDDERECLQALNAALAEEGYRTICTQSGREAWTILGMTPIDLVITDIRMPELDGLELIQRLNPRETGIEALVVTGVTHLDQVTEAMRYGVYDYLVKPLDLDRLLTSVAHALERRHLTRELNAYHHKLEQEVAARTLELENTLKQLEEAYRQTIFALGAALETRDIETEAHAYRVMLYGRTLAAQAGMPELDIRATEFGLYLHDIGKIGVPDAILRKEGPLTEEEWEEMKKHPDIGRQLLEPIDFLQDAKEIVYSHHERWDGSGYPRGLKGKAITVGARIFAIVDAFDAMTSDRPYRKAFPLEQALHEIRRHAGTQFDPELAELFLAIPPETWVQCRHEALKICRSWEEKRRGFTPPPS
ncbi:MAG: response regulator [Nitrospirae bacterium]|nr:MAG: response regulator [Nitrospirota bacterium]